MAVASAPPAEEPLVVTDPMIPYVETLPGGLYPGRAIVLKGAVLHDPHQHRFAIELCCGLLVHGDHQDDKALHFNPRFDTNTSWFGGSADRQIVLNSMIANRWGMEERYANVFKEGSPFSMRILILSDYYKIAVNGRHLCDYLHRIPITDVRTIYIRGNVRINTIEYQGMDGAGVHVPKEVAEEPRKLSVAEVIRRPDLPFGMELKEKLSTGIELVVTGTPLMNAERFTIDLLTAREYFFHFRVDFRTGKEKEAVVRNSTRNGVWQKEEREMCAFPFVRGITFDIIFRFDKKHISITIDGGHFANFNYREFSKLDDVQSITVKGDLSVQKICLRR